jgi:hypothetical protein
VASVPKTFSRPALATGIGSVVVIVEMPDE